MGAAQHAPESEAYGVGSFVWRSHRPLHPERLWRRVLEDDALPPVLRSKVCCALHTGWAQHAPSASGAWLHGALLKASQVVHGAAWAYNEYCRACSTCWCTLNTIAVSRRRG